MERNFETGPRGAGVTVRKSVVCELQLQNRNRLFTMLVWLDRHRGVASSFQIKFTMRSVNAEKSDVLLEAKLLDEAREAPSLSCSL